MPSDSSGARGLARRPDPPVSRTLPDLLDELAGRQPGREFIVGGVQRLTYAQTRARARRLAKGLRRLGVAAGDRSLGS